MISASVAWLADRFYSDHRSGSDFLNESVQANLRRDSVVLDLGCGGGTLYPFDYRTPERLVVGVDIDPALKNNRLIDGSSWASVNALPFDGSSFDLVYSRYVFEHLPAPQLAFDEVARVLRPNGMLIVLTPNAWHYVSIISRLTPSVVHKMFNERLRKRAADDTFPTLYRANTRRALAQCAKRAGMEEAEVVMIETRPNYLMWSLFPFLAGVAYERVVNSTEIFRDFRVNILGIYRKPGVASD